MRIAVNTRLLLPGKLEGIGWFTHETMRRVVEAHPEHTFLFLFDRPYDPQFVYAPNVEPVVMGPPTRHPLLYRLWFNMRLPRKLKALQADAFISPDGFLALRSDVPTLAVIHDLNFEHHPQDLPRAYRHYYRTYFPRFARHARRIVTVSAFSRADLVRTYGVPADRIDVVHNGVGEVFRPLDDGEKAAARARWTGGHPYFVCVGSLNPRKNLARTLRAFDTLLTAQPSELRLLVVGEPMWRDGHLDAALASMRHRHRVVFTGRLQQRELHHALGAAMALLFVSYFEGFGIPLVEAMRCGVPAVAANATSLPEVAGDAALYCDPYDVADITRAMAEIRDDAQLRRRLGEAGVARSAMYTWDRTAEGLWAAFMRMMGTVRK